MNPYHISYIKSLQYNTLKYFYTILEGIDEKKREELLADILQRQNLKSQLI